MKQIYVIAAMSSVLLAAAPLHAASEGALGGGSNLAVQSSDGSGGSLGSSQQGSLGTSGASSNSRSEGALAAPDVSALDGYLDVGSGDFAKTQAALERSQNRGAQKIERVVQRAAASQQTVSPSGASSASATRTVESTTNRIQDAASRGPSGFGLSTPSSVGGIDLAAGLDALSLRGSAR